MAVISSKKAIDKQAKILIVDDEQIVREVLEGLLLYEGYNLAFAQNGAEAFEKIANFGPDLILLDVMMPQMNGFEVCRRLKADEKWRHIPIILITALDGKEDLATGIDAGADDFLSKPFNNLELLARARSMLRIKSQYDDLEKQQRALENALELNKKFGRVVAQHLAELELLHEVGLRLMNNLDMDSVLALATQTAFELIPEAVGCVIHFLSDEEQSLLPVVFLPGNKAKTVYPSVGSEEITRQVLAARDIIYLPDMLTDFPHSPSPLGDIRAILVTPLVDHQNILGTFSLYSFKAYAFEKNHQHILPILANQTAVAISKAQSIEKQSRIKEREKWVIRDLFQRYVSPSVVERLVDGVEDLALGGKRQEISVLFADIRSFTTFSENQPPEHLIEVLNQYLALAVEAILEQEGTLDKFMGDAVMAIFNAPLHQSHHPLRAVRAAVAMQQAIAAYNATIASCDHLSFGIGIHVGQAVVGNIGTKEQLNYTAIGDTVNLAKRLQEQAEEGQIILSQAAYDAVRDWVTIDALGSLSVKGRTAAVEAYRLISLDEFKLPPAPTPQI